MNTFWAERDLALRALDVERVDTEKPRKDLRKWADFRPIYCYFFTALFEPVTDPADSRFGGLPADVVRRLCADLLDGYQDRPHSPHAARYGTVPNALVAVDVRMPAQRDRIVTPAP